MTVALDLFAGHGWGVACRALGIEEYGVEIMPEAVAVRELNGMRTIYNDVWEGLLDDLLFGDVVRDPAARADGTPGAVLLDYDLLIASPPCQTFSMAGSGAGRKALDEVLAAIDARLYLDPAKLVAFGETHDPKTALVLAPLAHIARDLPMHVVLEQVPPVLPVWERYAEEMRRWGYSVWTGNLQAEQYGVPQTRKRAILIARADGVEAKMPTPTHNRYNPRAADGGRYADPALLPWVSMADALGWGMTERPMVTAGNAVGRAEGVGGSGAKAAIQREQSRGAWVSNQNTSTTGERYERDADLPAPTMTAGQRSAKIMRSNYSAGGGGGAATGGAEVFGRHGRAIVEKMHLDPEKPATTVAGDPRLSSRDHHGPGDQARRATRVTIEEAALLQSYPADFRWDAEAADSRGRVRPITKTNTFLQIGNAVPPKLAEAILREVLS